ncbi:MAG: tRNA (N6-isopentenyl adenosine(37)-C2)-methylthiotransferase MiaB [Desulfocapsa sp.]|uniref:tRNA-2-methylthio-N(6)-dimethylallyladenosine synthase n=1 Tax=Desulfotalea psychrophila TaxID=84980 RepID=A0ABS3AS19_9BACT|nr:tRNA (N6-isopentenyl adenosine(37)-C2)-methylthiotransferase MiaB [Desulfocapsa sp.]MBN4058642.1 tRNA (N6-isopentenyl adenosine(37)-C2)-methylthiotransferase MiaB [Desulfocapsa sp. AH-315-J15]MBN4067925.1 tRNA (N6-isopentenyl adenosine(37)-C2)-methylthiotransferase MiaB [Desulfotalea psychrophila]
MILESLYLRIDPARYHFLKFILEAYDGLCLLSTVPDKKGCVCIRYSKEQDEILLALLSSLASSLKPGSLPSKRTNKTPMSSQLFFIKTFGCQMNERDSEIMAQLLSEKGYIETGESDDADLIILNTCSIRAKAEQKVMSLLGVLRKHKKRNPNLKICVAGCVAQQEGEQIIKRMPHVDLVVGTQNIYELAELLEDIGKPSVLTELTDDYSIPAFIPNLNRAGESGAQAIVYKKFLTIMQGCNNFCTYCVVPFTRGREVSRSVEHILKEAHALVEGGVKEITLLGQNVNSYGKTNSVSAEDESYAFSKLLRAVAKVPGLERLRFTTSNPKDLSDDLMRCFAEVDILCPQFHLPVQSGSNSILSRMNRKYTRELYLEKVAALRSYCPEIAITTDMIIGFPGETDQDFEETMSLLEEVYYHGSYSFKYSDRPGTRSEAFEDKVEESIKSARLLRFQTRQDEISLEHNKRYIGKKLSIMIEKSGKKSLIGRTETNHLVHIPDTVCKCKPGDLKTAVIVHAGHHSLRGTLQD